MGVVSYETTPPKRYTMKRIVYAIVIFIVFAGCQNKVDVNQEYMTLHDVKKAYLFPEIQTLKRSNMQSVKMPDYYLKNFIIVDSLLFVDTNQENGLLDIISLKSMKSYGRYLDKGKAKGEFLYGINLTLQTTFECKNDSLYANIYDSGTGGLFKLNITKTIIEKHASLKGLNFYSEIPHSAFWAKTISDTLLLVRNIDEMETHQNRSIITREGIQTNHAVQKLNNFEIPINEDFNIMSSLISISPSREYIIEAMIGMNYINIYSLNNNNIEYTICVGKELDKLSDILSTSRYNRKYVFADLRTYNFGFAVLKYDITERTFQSEEKYAPAILFFDWSGNPIGAINSEIKFNHFDYDELNEVLYILDSDNKMLKIKIHII